MTGQIEAELAVVDMGFASSFGTPVLVGYSIAAEHLPSHRVGTAV